MRDKRLMMLVSVYERTARSKVLRGVMGEGGGEGEIEEMEGHVRIRGENGLF